MLYNGDSAVDSSRWFASRVLRGINSDVNAASSGRMSASSLLSVLADRGRRHYPCLSLGMCATLVLSMSVDRSMQRLLYKRIPTALSCIAMKCIACKNKVSSAMDRYIMACKHDICISTAQRWIATCKHDR
ncbi:hypothetical protein O6H91_19G035100 [Diphasiastrum complanatum]|uniref:Uncharacterized protein n=1 Tax=Diphasiastrum complanatum TaxID=34168 RepID=A0ACC2AUE8_DIPCM|nr:hypothetical protein O6H91_19G035100 [Diphasiastrum complanatum]